VDWSLEVNKVVEWMKKYNQNIGTQGFVMGLSGGIDSAVVACLAVKAVGKKNVVGIALPDGEILDHYTRDASDLAKNLGLTFFTNSMSKALSEIKKNIEVYGTKQATKRLTISNLKARLRMLYLYAFGSEYNLLVAGTGNLSELKIGYFTKYGDGGVDIEPLGNYLKTEVYKMAEQMPEIPESIINKPPSAALFNGQTDEEELGITYKRIDSVLVALQTKKRSLIDALPMKDIDKVMQLIRVNAHKNKVPPRFPRNVDITEYSF